ncbi:MAG TPA: hypothetical protein VKA60_10790 [Blastocatellia bacterium]|nr:hypothetical protein [Blastocatellia bacterium]
MDGTGTLKLQLVDVYGNRIKDTADVFVRHLVLNSGAEKRGFDATKMLQIAGLDSTQNGIHQVQVFPTRYRPVSQFVRINEGKVTSQAFVFPVDPRKVTGIAAPAYAALPSDLKTVLENSSLDTHAGLRGEALYAALDDPRKACLLNLTSKMQHTVFQNGRDVLSYLTSLVQLIGDRVFANVQTVLHDETQNSVFTHLFHAVPDVLHTPLPGFALVDSYKTPDHYGNLQLTFSRDAASGAMMADIDMDDAQGIEHIFQVISHRLTGIQTNPYDIHEIMLANQKIDPSYTLIV